MKFFIALTDFNWLSSLPRRVGRWWQKVVLTTGFYRLKPAGKNVVAKVAKHNINFIMKSFLILVSDKS